MPRRSREDVQNPELRALLERVSETGPGRLPLIDQASLLAHARATCSDAGPVVDRWLLSEMEERRQGLADARRFQSELKALHDRLTSPPWHVAVYLRSVEAALDTVLVLYQGTPRVVTLGVDVDVDTLSSGDDVLLSQELNVVIRRLTPGLTRVSEVALFEQRLDDGRIVLKVREAEVVASAAQALDTGALEPGDRVRWDPAMAMALERLPRPSDSAHFLKETPSESFADIGGLDRQVQRLQRAIRLHMRHPALVARYHLRRTCSVLLVGPPGTGKTMMARALARWLGDEAPGGRSRFMHIKPAALHSMWYAESEANYREAFRVAREAGAADPGVPVVLFFDEVDAIGLTRGNDRARVDDRVLTSFMAELDGLEPRGNVLVVAATNRRDALDPALLRAGRLGDVVLEIPRPSMAAARTILERHLPADIPYATGDGVIDPRRDAIDALVSRLYAPNGEGEVASITFRDGTRRAVTARDLASGAMLGNIARLATQRACERECDTGVSGIRRDDLLDAAADELANAVAALSPASCHAHITDLPQDLAVARVAPAVTRPRRVHRFLSAA